MQYVTKFINVIGSYYGEIGINSANSTGATDVIVVEQEDGTYKCSPFHVRFGKLNILRPKEVIVDLYLNNEFVKELNMRVEPTGQAYFELQNEDSALSTEQKGDDAPIKINDYFEDNPLISPIASGRNSNKSFEDDTYEPTNENQSGNDIIDPGYRSSDEILFSNSKLSHMFDFRADAKLSLCGNFESWVPVTQKALDTFYSHVVAYDEFSKNPYEIINNANLVVLYNNSFMNWKTFSIIMISRLGYQKTISETDISTSKISSKKGYRKWLKWGSPKAFNNESTTNKTSSNDISIINDDHGLIYSSRQRTLSGDILFPENIGNDSFNVKLDDTKSNNVLIPSNDIPPRSVDDSAVHFTTRGIKKTNILPNEKLKLLKLNEGVNELFYVITGKYRGTIKVGCKVYLWHWVDRIVVSDIDGTITKSDVWGQLAPWLGLDWTQSGIVKLYNSIQKNLFRFVYLSARAIGQADQTRDYLQNVNQQGMFLPDGPLLLAPNSFIIAFKKEVIDKTPEEFKINCLSELKGIFPAEKNHYALYAGFGNKPSDEITYKTVGIPESKIFTVNKKGELHNKALFTCFTDSIKTYDTLTQLVNQYFPSIYSELPYSNEYSSFSFWRNDIPYHQFNPSFSQ